MNLRLLALFDDGTIVEGEVVEELILHHRTGARYTYAITNIPTYMNWQRNPRRVKHM
jgi:hypothetical protein